MSLLNALGWAIIDWRAPTARTVFLTNTAMILAGYVVIWFLWQGRNWARILVLLTSVLALVNLLTWGKLGIVGDLMIGSEAALAVFLLIWLNTANVRAYFKMNSTGGLNR